jgi:hypothetical protein
LDSIGIIVLRTPGEAKGDKGDYIFDTPHAIEFAAFLLKGNPYIGTEVCALRSGYPVSRGVTRDRKSVV